MLINGNNSFRINPLKSPLSGSVLSGLKSSSPASSGDKFIFRIKSGPVRLENPFSLFNKKSTDNKLKFPSVSSSEPIIHWDRQYTDKSVIKGAMPKGFKSIKTLKNVPIKKIQEIASLILKKGNPLGTITPFQIDGQNYVAVDQTHYGTYRNGKEVSVPKGLHGVTVFASV